MVVEEGRRGEVGSARGEKWSESLVGSREQLWGGFFFDRGGECREAANWLRRRSS